jgi:hypothetical protein
MKKNPEIEAFIELAVFHSGRDCLIWPYQRDESGYARAGPREKGGTRHVPRIVCERLNGPPPINVHAGHTCGRGQHGCVSGAHLEWQTPRQNTDDRGQRGATARGERSGRSKLTESQINEIRKSDETGTALAKKYKVSHTQIYNVKNRKRWTHV